MKQLIRNIFKRFGYTLIKDIKHNTEGTSDVKVGKFNIKIFNRSGLKECYWYAPDYGAQLTHLTSVLHKAFPGLSAVDIGANQGDSVSLIKSAADVPVISVEGDGTLAELFQSNTAQFKNVTLIRTFLSDVAGEMACTFDKEGHNLTILPAGQDKNAKLTSFSSIDKLYQDGVLNESCKLLKIDTEGFDLKIMRGGDRFVKEVKPAILFEFNPENLAAVETDAFSIFPWLLSHGYDSILFYESDGRFMFSASLNDQHLMKQLFDYIDGNKAKIYYLDIVTFHADDKKIANEMILLEEQHRLAGK